MIPDHRHPHRGISVQQQPGGKATISVYDSDGTHRGATLDAMRSVELIRQLAEAVLQR